MAYTLFDEHGNLTRDAMRRQIKSMFAHGVHGVGVLGLASEFKKLSTVERLIVMEWVAEDVAGKVPLSVTVAEPKVHGQVEFVRAAYGVGAKWVILQPPQVKGAPESEPISFFGAVADASPIPIAIQNAPEYLGIGLSNLGIKTLNRVHPNVSIVKLEATAVSIARLLDDVSGAVDVFNGRGGIEMIDSLRAGAVGIVPGGETFDVLLRIFDSWAGNSETGAAEAAKLYEHVLPLLVFLMDSMDTFLLYGKHVLGNRLDLKETSPRAPHSPITEVGFRTAKQYSKALGKL
jgi:2-keto-3-deoxy-L-arabinonate dehydratase